MSGLSPTKYYGLFRSPSSVSLGFDSTSTKSCATSDQNSSSSSYSRALSVTSTFAHLAPPQPHSDAPPLPFVQYRSRMPLNRWFACSYAACVYHTSCIGSSRHLTCATVQFLTFDTRNSTEVLRGRWAKNSLRILEGAPVPVRFHVLHYLDLHLSYFQSSPWRSNNYHTTVSRRYRYISHKICMRLIRS